MKIAPVADAALLRWRCHLYALPEFRRYKRDGVGSPCVLRVHYACADCGHEWSCEWSRAVHEVCPRCEHYEAPWHRVQWLGPRERALRRLWCHLPDAPWKRGAWWCEGWRNLPPEPDFILSELKREGSPA